MTTVSLSQSRDKVALGGLSDWLFENGYKRDSLRLLILDLVRTYGTCEAAIQSGLIDREHAEIAERVLEESQPEVPFDDLHWLIEPVLNDHVAGDSEFWTEGEAIPSVAKLALPSRHFFGRLIGSAAVDLGDDIPFMADNLISECD